MIEEASPISDPDHLQRYAGETWVGAAEGGYHALVKDGKPQMPIISGSVAEPVAELRRYLKEISGADFEQA